MFKTVTVHVHNPTQEEYDNIPLPEEGTDDGNLKWKAYGNVTVFQPRNEGWNGSKTTCEIEFKSYDDDEDYALRIKQQNDA